MTFFLKKTACLVCAAAAFLTFSGCSRQDTTPTETLEPIVLPTAPVAEETTPAQEDPYAGVEELALVLEAGELYILNHYPDLKAADLSGSTCYGAILDFAEKHPQIDIIYSVPLGKAQVSSKETSVSLPAGELDFDMLLENLQYLPGLTAISLPDIPLTAEQVHTLEGAYPGVTLEYSVELLDTSYDVSTTELDLSNMGSSRVEEVLPKLGLLTNLTSVKLSNSLSFDEVDKLQEANPQAVFHYSFNLFGKTLSTADETVEYKDQSIGNQGEDEIRKALKILDNCSRFVLDNCGIDYEILAQIREDFRDGPKVVWRIRFGVGNRYNTLTDDDTIKAVENVTDETCGPMKYLEDVKYMDLGHNDTLTDLSFVGNMPELEVLIVSGCAVTDLTGFDNCKKLTWLELAYCGHLKNIDVLAGCESLRFLNLSYTKVSNYMPLDSLPLERFVCLSPKASTEEQDIFVSIHPKEECITVFYGQKDPYQYGWRYNDRGKTFFEYYRDVVRVVFEYDKADRILNAQKKAAGK